MATSHRRIRLAPAFQAQFVANDHQCCRLTVVAEYAHAMPVEIFAYRALPIQPGQAAAWGLFSHICSPVDLEEFPIGAPYVNALPPWFRLDRVDLLLRSRVQADEVWTAIQNQVAALIASLDAADQLTAEPPVWLGYVQESDGGSSIGSLVDGP